MYVFAILQVQLSIEHDLKSQPKQLAAQLISSVVRVTPYSKLTWICRIRYSSPAVTATSEVLSRNQLGWHESR